jgi:hypothetical protein
LTKSVFLFPLKLCSESGYAHNALAPFIETPLGEGMHDGRTTNVTAVQFLRRLRGGSQPILVQASDGFLYVLKFRDNLQGENVPFNEWMGNEVFHAFGLPGPEWTAVLVTDEFLDHNPKCWIQTENGTRRPRPGWCFGSMFLGMSEAPLLEILPGSSFCRIRNRADFWKAWVLDFLAENADSRQALFLDEAGWLFAYFIDHGHLFGGPHGDQYPEFPASGYLDLRVYSDLANQNCNNIQRDLESVHWSDLVRKVEELPHEWLTGSGPVRFERFVSRASDISLVRHLRRAVCQFIKKRDPKVERGRGHIYAGWNGAISRAQVRRCPPTREPGESVDNRSGGQEPRRAEALLA